MAKNKKSKILKITIVLFLCYITIILCVISVVFFFNRDIIYNVLETKDIENKFIETGLEVYDSKNILIGKLYSDNRIIINFKELPKNLIHGLIAKEDIRFYCHSGIDFKSIVRAVYFLGSRGGGSTISQQVAKLLFTKKYSKNKFKRFYQKILECIIAIEIERKYTKEEIITMYVNKFDFLYNAKGIEMASRTYFNKKTSELNLNEIAIIIGMFENPYLYNPKLHPIETLKQRNLVLNKMNKYHLITEKEYYNTIKKKIILNFGLQNKNIILNTYYSYFLKKELNKLFNKHKKETGNSLNVKNNGLKVYISIDSSMQKYAESSIKKHLSLLQSKFNKYKITNPNYPFFDIKTKKINQLIISTIRRTTKFKYLKNKGLNEKEIINIFKKPENIKIFTWTGDKEKKISIWNLVRYNKSIIQAGLLSIDAHNGNIKAWVGGVDFNHFKYDHVYQSKRQSGSLFKPFIFTNSIDILKYTPCSLVSNEKLFYNHWSPKNINNKYGGYMTLKDALAYSINTVAVRLLSIMTPKSIIDLAKKIGIKSYIPNNLSIALGSSDVSLFELTSAFNIYNNYGIYIKPKLLLKIENRYGKLIEYNDSLSYQAIKDDTAYIMLKLMQNVVNYGTAQSIRYYGVKGEVAAKTGTSNNYSDGWFVGLTPNLTTVVWVGWEDRSVHFKNSNLGQGSKTALPIWSYYMMFVYSNKQLKYTQYDKFQTLQNFNYIWNICE